MRHGAADINRIILFLMLAGCGALPALDERSVSTAFTDTDATRLGRAVTPRVAAHPGK